MMSTQIVPNVICLNNQNPLYIYDVLIQIRFSFIQRFFVYSIDHGLLCWGRIWSSVCFLLVRLRFIVCMVRSASLQPRWWLAGLPHSSAGTVYFNTLSVNPQHVPHFDKETNNGYHTVNKKYALSSANPKQSCSCDSLFRELAELI